MTSKVVERVRAGEADFQWYQLRAEDESGNALAFCVLRAGLTLPHVSGPVFPMVTADEQQQVCDLLDACLPTPKIMDLAFRETILPIPPQTRIDGRIAALAPVEFYSERVRRVIARRNKKLSREPEKTLIRTIGKSWVLSARFNNTAGMKYKKKGAINYGMHSRGQTPYPSATIPGVFVWQPEQAGHNNEHADATQVVEAVLNDATWIPARGALERTSIPEVLQDPGRAHIISHTGPLKFVRQPTTPLDMVRKRIVLPPVNISG